MNHGAGARRYSTLDAAHLPVLHQAFTRALHHPRDEGSAADIHVDILVVDGVGQGSDDPRP